MKILLSLLKEDSKISSMRLMALSCVIAAIILAIVGVCLGRELMGLAALCSAFIGPAMVAKVYQKNLEK